ncbi:MAG TPA: PA2928 family protein, partial [Chthoniobacterales bacterium]|nr:PA2928 family protein [Chthoniobacterales bacterium]
MNKPLLPAITFHRRTVTLLGAVALLELCSACSKSSFRPPEREGPPALVKEGGEPRFWLLQKQEEQRSRHISGGSRSIGKWVTDIYYHFDLQAHDPATADRIWKKRLLTVKDDAGGHTAQARILGQEGEVVWLFLNDGPVAVSSKDATRLADRKMIEERNPSLRDLV